MPSSDGPLLRSSAQPSHCTQHTANAVKTNLGTGSTISTESGRVTGTCDGPGVWAGFQWRRNRGSGGSMNRGPELLGRRVVGPQKYFRQDS